ncbi:formate--tetrahydrofolate ligase, partial [Henriciella sp.]|uniref:formate--tetrahydrofolate ligase n=1 Tax=Henriciella sp. TaxID=1968823 RepID=UPI0025C52C1F
DTESEIDAIRAYVAGKGTEAVVCTHWANGSEGTLELAEKVAAIADADEAEFAPLYRDELGLMGKIEAIATGIYGASAVSADPSVHARLKRWEGDGYGHLPVCMAKTQNSFSADPALRGAPSGFVLPVRDVRLSAGAGFVVALCGEIMTMPGLPRVPAAESIGLDADGNIEGLS